jgi:hypothetical protein
MNNLIEVSHHLEGDLSEENNVVEITAEYEDFTFKSVVTLDIQLDYAEEPELGLKESFRLDGISFFNTEILDEMSNPMSLGDVAQVIVHQEIENYLDTKVQEL